MTLAHERRGQGPELVLIHGWGLHGGIWRELAATLACDYTVLSLDLPGHGRSRERAMPARLAELTDQVAALVRGPAVWLGWSLGGLVALDLARRHAPLVTRLVLTAATPRFVQAPDWSAAMTPKVFVEFAAGLGRDYRATVLRFLSLQAGGDAGRALIRRLRTELFAYGEPDPLALARGLGMLEHADLRGELKDILVPTLVVHGGLDRLCPPAAGEYLAAQLPDARLALLPGAGHAPFLSQPQRFGELVRGFLT
jgi:pimeloyl-[acyl-carrier protein] methyl ester esterase